jgi:hypothetical protein
MAFLSSPHGTGQGSDSVMMKSVSIGLNAPRCTVTHEPRFVHHVDGVGRWLGRGVVPLDHVQHRVDYPGDKFIARRSIAFLWSACPFTRHDHRER